MTTSVQRFLLLNICQYADRHRHYLGLLVKQKRDPVGTHALKAPVTQSNLSILKLPIGSEPGQLS